MKTKWCSEVFRQAKEETGESYRVRYPDVPVSTPSGVAYVPGRRGSEFPETVEVGLPPLDQLVEFLNERGDAIKEWRIVAGPNHEGTLQAIFKIEVDE